MVKRKTIYIIPFLILLICCNHKIEQKNIQDQHNAVYHSGCERTEADQILDTLVFNDHMNGKELFEKYDFGHSELKHYKQFIPEQNVWQKHTLTDKHTTTQITYLGKLMDLDHITFYHVLTVFEVIGVGSMESTRGISKIAFINENMEEAIFYRMGMPDELPTQIENNLLYFNYQSKKIGISILGGLPPFLCVPKIGCN